MKLECKGWNGISHDCSILGQDGYCPMCIERLENPEEDYKKTIVFRRKPARLGEYSHDGKIRLILTIPKNEQWKINDDHEYTIYMHW